VLYNQEVRELMPRIDLESITFPTGSAAIQPSQAEELAAIGNAMQEMIDENPDELFLIEGHTDTVGGEVMNLALSDRRAESVALALTEYFDIPPENMITQGYGERFLKYPIAGDVRENRRAAVRRITPLIRSAQR
jgi:outer membrane protein OmpA-like peptidoglycan-associated protein